jgi:hypothetical protein
MHVSGGSRRFFAGPAQTLENLAAYLTEIA